MKVLKKDFKDNFKMILIWIIASAAMGFLTVSIYDTMIANSMDEWNKMMQTMPKAMLDAFKITSDTFNNILSYYAMEGYLYVSLLLSIFASMFGSKLINKEESEGTIEFILTKPISRVDYIKEKLITLITTVTIANIITYAIVYIGMLIGSSKSFELGGFLSYALGTYLITIAFGLITFMIASILKRTKGMTGIAIGFVFLSFFLSILANITDSLSNLKYFSLFEYINPSDLLDNGMPVLSLIVFATIIVGTIITSFIVYKKKDIYN